jgi:hypothetical protein
MTPARRALLLAVLFLSLARSTSGTDEPPRPYAAQSGYGLASVRPARHGCSAHAAARARAAPRAAAPALRAG